MTESLTGETSSKEEISQTSAQTEDKYSSSQGRIRGLPYFIKMTLMMTLSLSFIWFLFAFERVIFNVLGELFLPSAYLILSAIILKMMFYTVQRLQDTGNKTWLAIFILVPVVSIILFLYLIFAPSVADINAHGAPPPLDSLRTKIIALVLIPIAAFSTALFMTYMIALTMPVSIFIALIFFTMIDSSESIQDSRRAPPPPSQAVIVAILITLLPFLVWLIILFMNQVRDWW
ncbi:MAG: DUF805 domain-containing protein [Thiotrichaceae bacterium]|nr:DUF805 domain-containing protein [Thiotrichaceae bacterium]